MKKLYKYRPLITTIIGIVALTVTEIAQATIWNFSHTGKFTALDSVGSMFSNTSMTPTFPGETFYRTDIDGTLAFDDVTGDITLTVTPFDFFSGTAPLTFSGTTFNAIGDGMGGPGSLAAGRMFYDWDTYSNVPVDFVFDYSGLSNAVTFGMSVGDYISGDELYDVGGSLLLASVGSALPASDGALGGGVTDPIGFAPVAMTSWDLNPAWLTNPFNPPLINDPSLIGGTPMTSGPFSSQNFNLDIGTVGSLHLLSTSPSTVPVPATVWLFGSGLIGLIGVARRKKT